MDSLLHQFGQPLGLLELDSYGQRIGNLAFLSDRFELRGEDRQ